MIRVPRVRFLWEQDGPNERALKTRLSDLFKSHPHVSRAYLAHVEYDDGSSTHEVALCLAAPDDQHLVRQIGAIFRELTGKGVRLDILFLTQTQEEEVQNVCKPFHTAG